MTSQWALIMSSQWGAHCEITMGNDVARDIHCDVIMHNDVAMCIYHGRTMHNDVAMNIFYYVSSAICLIVLFYYRSYGIKTRISSRLISLGWRTHLLCLFRVFSLILRTREISLYKDNSCFLPILIKHSHVLVIRLYDQPVVKLYVFFYTFDIFLDPKRYS